MLIKFTLIVYLYFYFIFRSISKENGKLKVDWFTLKKLPLDVRKCQIKNLSIAHKQHISPELKAQR